MFSLVMIYFLFHFSSVRAFFIFKTLKIQSRPCALFLFSLQPFLNPISLCSHWILFPKEYLGGVFVLQIWILIVLVSIRDSALGHHISILFGLDIKHLFQNYFSFNWGWQHLSETLGVTFSLEFRIWVTEERLFNVHTIGSISHRRPGRVFSHLKCTDISAARHMNSHSGVEFFFKLYIDPCHLRSDTFLINFVIKFTHMHTQLLALYFWEVSKV